MNSLTGGEIFAGEFRHQWMAIAKAHPSLGGAKRCLFLSRTIRGARCFRSAESTRSEFSGRNAYELLEVSETSSCAEIKASFRRLAKLTHPDLAESNADSDSLERFVQILAAYEILSDSEKRAHYDTYLFSQRKLLQKQSCDDVRLNEYDSRVSPYKKMEVVEWLKWYRFAIQEILSERRVVVGNGYFDVLERDFYSAIDLAYYGPVIESVDFLPDRFEAEERSVFETPEVLHLVSGRDLFGMVYLTNKVPELEFRSNVILKSSTSVGTGICRTSENARLSMNFDGMYNSENKELKNDNKLHAYADLELRVYGRAVAVATRLPPKGYCDGIENDGNEDHIHVFLYSDERSKWVSKGFTEESFSSDFVGARGARIPLGTISGLGTSSDEGSCFVYNSSGYKTHVIMKHRTLLVKHMHWYGVGEEVSVCECRCSRARLPPSKYWLFEPRCGTHDIGGWYIETFGRDKKGRTVPSQRCCDGFDPNEPLEKRLHPAMYLLALAYRTLDLEDARIRKRTVLGAVEHKLSRILRWCKKLV